MDYFNNIQKRPLEILAPAGSWDALNAAVKAGADAVYLATTQFGARASAKNFDLEQLKEAVLFCHERGVKLYLTMNTLITDSEMPTALHIAQQAYKLQIDAIIVQDVGFAAVLHKSMPNLHLHGSTQMSVHTPQGAKLLYSLGFTRVVLAREMTMQEIAEVARLCPIELEVFVHGALCMCVSGQCYFSAMLGSRSGNRGQCAQTCRLPFMVEGGTGHDLSLKDMSILEHLQQLNSIGVTSAKIEGRMKRPEYVASAVNVARQFYDNGIAGTESCEQLKNVFSRSGFTDGYYTGKHGADMFGTRQKEDVISATPKVLNQIHSLYKNEYRRIPLEMNFSLKIGEPSALKVTVLKENPVSTVQTPDGVAAIYKNPIYTEFSAAVKGDCGEGAVNRPLTKEKAEQQLSKTGGTPYFVSVFNCDIENGATLPASSLNKLRRQALEELTTVRATACKAGTIKDAELHTAVENAVSNNTASNNSAIRAIFSDWDIPKEFAECQLVFIPENTPDDIIKKLIESGFNLGIDIKAGMFGREKSVYKNLQRIKALGVDNALVNNLGAIPICKELGFTMHGGFRLNVMNSESVYFFENLGLSDITVSFELTLQQIKNIGGNIERGALIYGRLPLMLTRNCPGVNSKTRTCKECGGTGYITDRKDITFPYKCSGGCTEIFNSVPLYMGDRLREVEGCGFYTMLFTIENSEEKLDALQAVKDRSKIDGGHTRGLYYKGVL